MSKQFAEFQLHDIFYIESSIRLKSADHIPGNTPFISSRSGNNGISAWVGNMNESLDSDVLGVNYNGSVLEAYYHPYKALFSDDVKRFKVRQPGVTFRAYLYCATAIRKLKEAYSYTKKFNGDEIDVARIKLPIADASVNTDTPEPDWEYMENYIKTIERKYIDQIAQVNAREQEILKQLYPEAVKAKPEAHGFGEVPLETIFEHTKSTAKVKNFEKETIETKTCTLPGLSATNTNNGFGFYLNENEHTPLSNCITVSANGINTGYAAYQGGKFGISQDSYALKLKDISGTKRQYLYFTGVLNKNNEIQYDYTTKAGWKRLSQDLVKVPVTSTGDIDWEYMENYIAWIETQERERVESYVRHARRRS